MARCERSFAPLATEPSRAGAEFRDALPGIRAELRHSLGLRSRVLVTGHQAEFYHAGVFAKELAAAHWAAAGGDAALFLIVDSDLPKQATLGLPEIAPRGLRRVEVRIPGLDMRRTTGAQQPAARSHWLDFLAEIARRTEHYESSLLREFSAAWLNNGIQSGLSVEAPISSVDAFDRARRAVLASLNCPALPALRISELARSPAFAAFVRAIALDAERFARDHNAAIDAYRARHGVRSASRPVAPLEISAERMELPFWRIRTDGTRARLFLERGRDHQPLVGTDEWIAPRALSLTAFVRLALADEFIHGIGGALYDEITEQFCGAYFGATLPAVTCVTATLQLPLPRHGVGVRELRAAAQRLRDWRHNPQRVAPGAPTAAISRLEDIAMRIRRARAERAPLELRGELHAAMEHLKEQIRAATPIEKSDLELELERCAAACAQDQIADDREYFYALHGGGTLRRLADQLAVGGGAARG